MKRSLDWFPVSVELISSVEFRRLSAAQAGAWLRLCSLAASRRSGGRVPGVRSWSKSDHASLLGVGSSGATIASLETAGFVSFDGDDLLVAHYPRDAEAKAEALRAAGTRGAEKRWGRESAGRQMELGLVDSGDDESPESNDFLDGQASRQAEAHALATPMQSKRESKSKSQISGSSLRSDPDPSSRDDGGGQQGLAPAGTLSPKAKKAPPWRRMLDRFVEGCGTRWAEGPVIDRHLAIRLGQIAKDLSDAGVGQADLRRAGAWAASRWREPLTPSWVATTGRLADAIARSLHEQDSPSQGDDAGWTVIRGGKTPQDASAGPPGDDPLSAA